MKAIGLILTTIGFTAGAFFSVLSKDSINWLHYLIALAIGIVGVVLLRIASHAAQRGDSKVEGDLEAVESGLAEIVSKIRPLVDGFEAKKVYALTDIIDNDFELPINRFVEGREAIAHRYGVDAYAEVMSEFATAERYLNRVWSCAAEGYVDEVEQYLSHSRDRFVAADNALRQYHSRDAAAHASDPTVTDGVPSGAHT